MGGSELVWRVKPKAGWALRGCDSHPREGPTDGTEIAISGLRVIILQGPQFPNVTDSSEILTSIFCSFPQPQQQIFS